VEVEDVEDKVFAVAASATVVAECIGFTVVGVVENGVPSLLLLLLLLLLESPF